MIELFRKLHHGLLRNILKKIYHIYLYCSFVDSKGNSSWSDNTRYISIIEKANTDYKHFLKFKKNKYYREVLEHVTKEQGNEYLSIIKKSTPGIYNKIEKFKINDLIGSPITYQFDDVGIFSPTTLRYVKVLADLYNLFDDLNNKTIIEIGVGYGGQLLVLDQIYKFSKYYLFDLPQVLQLTSKYLKSHNLNSPYKTETIDQYDEKRKYDLVISNYAFSELSPSLQLKYIKKILSKSARGYLTMNTGKRKKIINNQLNNKYFPITVEELKDYLPNFKIIEDKPSISPDNYILVWGNNS